MIAKGKLDQRHADLLAASATKRSPSPTSAGSSASSPRAATRRKVASVASFFVSRIDTEADRRLDELGGHDELKGKLAIANARLAYQHYKEIFAGPALGVPAVQGRDARSACCGPRRRSRTPTTRDTMYVEELIGPDTVNTMPEETIKAYQDHGSPRRAWSPSSSRRAGCSSELAEAGVDYKDVTDTLEREGVEKFADAFDELLQALARSARRSSPPERCAAGFRRAGAERRSAALRSRASGSARVIRSGPDGNAFARERVHAVALAAVAHRPARWGRSRATARRVLDQARAHVHQHVQAHEPLRQALVALVVLDREHEAADRAPAQTQRRACTGASTKGRRRRTSSAPAGAHAQAHDMLVQQRFDGCACRGRVRARDGAQQRLVALHAMDLRVRAPARLALVDQVGDVADRVDRRLFVGSRRTAAPSRPSGRTGRRAADRRPGMPAPRTR